MEKQQMPIFFEKLVLFEDDVYFELAWDHPYVMKSAMILIVLLTKREMFVLDYLHMNQCGPQNKNQNVHYCGEENYLEVDTCHWALSHYNGHGNQVVFSSFLLPCKSDVHPSSDHATFQPKIC